MAEEKLSLSLDDIISKNSKRPGKADGPAKTGRAPRRVSKGDGKAPTIVGKARALGVAVKNATKRPAPRRASGGTRREVEVMDYVEPREDDPRRPRLDVAKVRAALEGSAKWEHDKFEGGSGPRAGARRAESGYKLVISNLDYKVSDEDIKELFESFGAIKRAGIVYDRSGRSEEMAEVVFLKKPDAERALQRYNNVSLDGKPMSIELVAPTLGGRVVETLTSGLRLGDRLGGRKAGGGRGGGRGGGSERSITIGSGNLRSAQGGGGATRRAQGRLGGRRGGNDLMEE
jgi:THO complex subunit 4